MLYAPGSTLNMDPWFDFNKTLDLHILYLDDETADTVSRYRGELLLFWNWSHDCLRAEGEGGRSKIQHRLDFEIPEYLPAYAKTLTDSSTPITATK
jgi:hypothetical protein